MVCSVKSTHFLKAILLLLTLNYLTVIFVMQTFSPIFSSNGVFSSFCAFYSIILEGNSIVLENHEKLQLEVTPYRKFRNVCASHVDIRLRKASVFVTNGCAKIRRNCLSRVQIMEEAGRVVEYSLLPLVLFILL